MKQISVNKWNALTHFDETENLHVIMFAGKYGTIVSDADFTKAKEKFIIGMYLAEFVSDINQRKIFDSS